MEQALQTTGLSLVRSVACGAGLLPDIGRGSPTFPLEMVVHLEERAGLVGTQDGGLDKTTLLGVLADGPLRDSDAV